jgi:hypothetical protein
MACGDDCGKFQRVPEVLQHKEELSSGLKTRPL